MERGGSGQGVEGIGGGGQLEGGLGLPEGGEVAHGEPQFHGGAPGKVGLGMVLENPTEMGLGLGLVILPLASQPVTHRKAGMGADGVIGVVLLEGGDRGGDDGDFALLHRRLQQFPA